MAEPPHSPFERPLRTLLIVLLALAGCVVAAGDPVALGRLPVLPVWLLEGSHEGGPAAVALSADGTLWWVAGGMSRRLWTGLGGEQAEACGGAILAVDGLGRLQRVAGTPSATSAVDLAPNVSLHHRPACLDGVGEGAGLSPGAVAVVGADGDVLLLDREGRARARAEHVRALPDAELVPLDLPDVGPVLALLADPTGRYRHGVLGDEVEATTVLVLALPSLVELARWSPPDGAVIEQRRPTPWRAGDAAGLHLTVSDERHGARVVTLRWEAGTLVATAEGPSVGRSRWLHVLGAVENRLYAQHRPHLGGPLVRYEFGAALLGAPAGAGQVVPLLVETPLDVSSHVIGERNLDRAALLGILAPGVDGLALPRRDGGSVLWVRCDAVACTVVHETPLPARLATNLLAVGPRGAPTGLLAADASGHVWWLSLPSAFER